MDSPYLNAFLLLAWYPTTVSALAFGSPVPTDAAAFLPQTPPPSLPTLPPVLPDLLRRQANVETFWIAPDNTCGYVNGISTLSVTCATATESCAYLQTAAVGGYVGCCGDVTCEDVATACYGLSQVSQGVCGAACQANSHIVKCEASTAPFCVTANFFGGISAFFCSAQGGSVAVATTYSGEKGRTLEVLTTTVTSTSTTPSSSTSTTASSTTTVSSTTTTFPVSPTTTSPVPTTGSPSPTPVGAIVGGVVGGLAVIGLIVGLLVFFLLRSKRNNNSSNNGNNNNVNGSASNQPPAPQPAVSQWSQPVPGPVPYSPPLSDEGLGLKQDARVSTYSVSPSLPGTVSPYGSPPGASPGYTSPVAPIYEAPNDLSAASGFQGLYEMPGRH